MGATGSGKSALALELARRFDATIIACDSMQLYRGLDIGTAKPSKEEQRQVAHALIDVVTLPASGDAVWWAGQARRAIADCNRRGVPALIVGGTGMYLRALLQGLAPIPPENPTIRRRVDALRTRCGTPYLHRILRRVDPPLAARLAPHDSQRIARALAVRFSSGRPLSYWQQQRPEAPAIRCPLFVLEMGREALYPRLAARFHAMMEAGWLDEVRWLKGRNLPTDHPAVRAVGYRQLLAHLDGAMTLDEAVERGIVATRHYAKRQQTWFRHQCPDAVHGDAEALRAAITPCLREAYGAG